MKSKQKPTGLGWASVLVLEVNSVCTTFLPQPGFAVNREVAI